MCLTFVMSLNFLICIHSSFVIRLAATQNHPTTNLTSPMTLWFLMYTQLVFSGLLSFCIYFAIAVHIKWQGIPLLLKTLRNRGKLIVFKLTKQWSRVHTEPRQTPDPDLPKPVRPTWWRDRTQATGTDALTTFLSLQELFIPMLSCISLSSAAQLRPCPCSCMARSGASGVSCAAAAQVWGQCQSGSRRGNWLRGGEAAATPVASGQGAWHCTSYHCGFACFCPMCCSLHSRF